MALSPNQSKAASLLKWGLIMGTGLLVFPIILSSIVGLMGIGVCAVLGAAMWKFAPTISSLLTTYSMKLLRWNARKNPIPIRDKNYRANSEAVEEMEEKIRVFSGSVEQYKSKVAEFTKKNPEEAPRFLKHLAGMEQLRDLRYKNLKSVKEKLEAYKKETEKMSAIWDMSQASADMDDQAGLISEKDAIMQIEEMEAKSSVTQAMAQSFADLNHALQMQIDVTPAPAETLQLSHQPADVIEMPVFSIVKPDTAKVQR